jgi:hypothetical protein
MPQNVLGWASFTAYSSRQHYVHVHPLRFPSFVLARSTDHPQEVVDAEFERVKDDPMVHETDASSLPTSKSLFDLSLEADAEMSNTRVPFLAGDTFIDTKLAFMADCDGVSYGIGIPFDHAAAITIGNAY